MRTKSEIEKLAEETLNSIDAVEQVAANDFLFTRIQARIKDNTRQQSVPVKALSILSATLLLFIGLNTVSYFFLSNTNTEQAIQNITVKPVKTTSAAEAFAKTYNLITEQYNY
jgi:hypothetical protein